jgi:hypothetical protein
MQTTPSILIHHIRLSEDARYLTAGQVRVAVWRRSHYAPTASHFWPRCIIDLNPILFA